MSDAPNEEHSSLIKTPKQLVIVMVLAFLIPVLGIVLLVHLIAGGMNVDAKRLDMTEEAVAARLKPIGQVVISDAGATSGARSGEAVYTRVCAACHGAGLLNAPKLGDKGAWKPRIAQGRDTLYTHAIQGIRTMPPKGGAMAAPGAEIKAAVDYMLGSLK